MKNVAAGMLGAFIGRYNDIEGYWALGVLRADHADGSGVTQLSLPNRRAMPATPATERTVEKFGLRLQTMLAKQGFLPADISAADISIEFDPSVLIPPAHPVSYGEPFRCTVTLTDRLGKTYVASDVGRCARHDPRVESRSARSPVGTGFSIKNAG